MHLKRSLTALAALSLLHTGAAQASGGACASPQTAVQNTARTIVQETVQETVQDTTLTQTLGLTLPPSLLVLEGAEGATFASYRVLARMSVTDVAQRVGEALPGWTQTSSERGLRGATFFFTDASARTLRLRVQPTGRSNLFTLELKLTE